MEYTVQKLGCLAGISTRTLRYYHEIGILKPARVNSSGYRIYGQSEVDKLQQILFYRELGITLENIKNIVNSPDFDGTKALRIHRDELIAKREQLEILITNVDKTIASAEGSIKMSNKEKFQGFKKKMVEENEQKYGAEIREKYGNHRVEKSNAKVMNLSEEEYDKVTKIEAQFRTTLAEAFKEGDPTSEIAQKAAQLHKQWLAFYWSEYSLKAHAGLAQMYVDDERFTAYYDTEQPGTSKFLRDVIFIFTGETK